MQNFLYRSENVTAVTEVYVQFDDTKDLDRVFLYLDNGNAKEDLSDEKLAQADRALLDEGRITDGRLVIAYDRLKGLAEQGYKCLYHRSPDGHNGKAFVRYMKAFGDNRTMLPFQMWDSKAVFIGNGLNHALSVATELESLFVMPDIHTVQESIRVSRAENVIREKYDIDFRIGRIRETLHCCMISEKKNLCWR
ncbi:MAG: hypothetical protein ACI4AB_10470 [Acetatifactor sp.]